MKRCLSSATRARRSAYSSPPSSPSNSETEVVASRSGSSGSGRGTGRRRGRRSSCRWLSRRGSSPGSGRGRDRAAARGARRRSAREPSGRMARYALEHRLRPASSRSAARCSSPKISTGRRSDGLERVEDLTQGARRESSERQGLVEALAQRPRWRPALGHQRRRATSGGASSGRRVGEPGRGDVVGRVVEPLAEVVDVHPRGQQRQVERRPRPGGAPSSVISSDSICRRVCSSSRSRAASWETM